MSTIPTQAIYDTLATQGLEPCKFEVCPEFDLYGQIMLESRFVIGISESDLIVSCVFLDYVRYVHFALYLGKAQVQKHIRVELTEEQTYLSAIEDTAQQIHDLVIAYETQERGRK